MQIESISIDQIEFDPSNSRRHESKNLDAIKGSLVKFGQQKPIVVNSNNVVIAGNGTLAAARALKWKNINVVRSNLAGMEATAFAIADNRTAELAIWDDSILSRTLEGLKAEGFALADIGFDDEDLTKWLTAPEVVPPGCDEDEVPEHVEPKTKLGDLYQLGEHRLLCGDSTDILQVERLMAGAKADMVFTDPPYGIGLDYNTHDDSEAKWYDLIKDIMQVIQVVAPAFTIMPCCRITSLKWWYTNYSPDWIMCWYKGSPGHCSKIGFNDWEPHLVWGKPKNQMHDYWQTKCGFEIEGHPCPKPIEYCEWVLERAVDKGDLILDLFLGSGSTLIACEKTKRKCYGMELDPHYCDVIVARWEKFTGKKASLITADSQ